ncbi:MAG TPA: hypothetical protein VKB75_09125, partial [Jatrophihabitans sp.]|nr:hypothetical protein [Jatrophihabitans sp.]
MSATKDADSTIRRSSAETPRPARTPARARIGQIDKLRLVAVVSQVSEHIVVAQHSPVTGKG